MTKCTGMAMVGQQCPHDATWENEHGVKVCYYHKLMLNAFTWELRDVIKWTELQTDSTGAFQLIVKWIKVF